MQKVINFMAVFSFIGVASLTGMGIYIELNRDKLAEEYKQKVIGYISDLMSEELPGMVDSLLPEIPEVPSATGGPIPGPVLSPASPPVEVKFP